MIRIAFLALLVFAAACDGGDDAFDDGLTGAGMITLVADLGGTIATAMLVAR